MSWAKQEFETIELGDARLNQRAVLLAERLGQKPGASIPAACENWAETAAAYRFLRNHQANWEEVLSAHARASPPDPAGKGPPLGPMIGCPPTVPIAPAATRI